MIWYQSADPGVGDTGGNVLFESMHLNTNYPNNGANFVDVVSFVNDELQLASGLDMVPGQQIGFYDKANHNAWITTTTIVSRGSANQYFVADSVDSLDLTAIVDDLDAAHVDPLFILTGGEQLVVRDCTFREPVIQGNRLCSLQKGTADGGRTPIAHFIRLNNLRYDPMNLQQSLVNKYLWIKSPQTGDVYYRFKDCQEEISGDPPVSITNIP